MMMMKTKRQKAQKGLTLLGISKLAMHEFWYDYVKPKNGEKAKLC